MFFLIFGYFQLIKFIIFFPLFRNHTVVMDPSMEENQVRPYTCIFNDFFSINSLWILLQLLCENHKLKMINHELRVALHNAMATIQTLAAINDNVSLQ